MNVRKVIEDFLLANNYEGLYNEDGECGCQIGDLSPIGCIGLDCQPAHIEKPDPDSEFADCEWVMVPGAKGC